MLKGAAESIKAFLYFILLYSFIEMAYMFSKSLSGS